VTRRLVIEPALSLKICYANLEASALETKAIYVKQWPPPDFKKYTRLYKHYRIRAAGIEDHYPPGFVQLDGTIGQAAKPRENVIGAVKVAANGNSQVVVLRIADNVLSANIATHLPGESLEDIVRSFDTENRIWMDEPDRIVQQTSPGGRLSVEIKKQIVSGKRTLVVDINPIPAL
jgi:hypothetical protein